MVDRVGIIVLLSLVLHNVYVNGHEKHKYDTLQQEVSDLKQIVLDMNVELHNVKKQYAELKENMITSRYKHGDEDTNRPETSHKRDLGQITPHTRSAVYNPTLHLASLLNGTRIKASGPKGEKGESGTQGLKGDISAPGPRGQNGVKGVKGDMGLVGPKGPPGLTGQKGEVGQRGIPGAMGPKGSQGYKGEQGRKGNNGRQGLPGPRGFIGSQGQKGTKGNTGEKGNQGLKGSPGSCQGGNVSFSLQTGLKRIRQHGQNLRFDTLYWNNGNHFDPSTGVFTCRVPGLYLFILTLTVNPEEKIQLSINLNDHQWRFVTADGNRTSASTSMSVSGYLSRGNTISVVLLQRSKHSASTCYFEGFLVS
ncbi:complement C1q tumor necrosis factor-related protein 2-like [Argopecten irradians]|uniref:complement C1q tumor necrosis factor-related protein 2-like n=1 Tax=Argopecten irradians TaxID=31199 RepID=UPI003711B7EC